MTPDYDREAPRYDRTRGGLARAEAAAEAVAALLAGLAPAGLGPACLDVGGGTGLVAAGLVRRGVQVVVLDRSAGMLALASERVPGRVLRADAHRLPVRSGSVRSVLLMWLLHLLDDATPVLAEAARVLQPDGLLVTSVDKAAAHGHSDPRPTDARDHVVALGAVVGLVPARRGSYVGHGQGPDGRPDPVFTLLALRRC